MAFPTHRLSIAVGAAIAAISSLQRVNAEQWYFFVKNESKHKIVKLEVKEKNGGWGGFSLGGGIAPGKTKQIIWAESTNNQDCNQYLRATFSDGARSPAGKFDFCKDLDTPIVYTD